MGVRTRGWSEKPHISWWSESPTMKRLTWLIFIGLRKFEGIQKIGFFYQIQKMMDVQLTMQPNGLYERAYQYRTIFSGPVPNWKLVQRGLVPMYKIWIRYGYVLTFDQSPHIKQVTHDWMSNPTRLTGESLNFFGIYSDDDRDLVLEWYGCVFHVRVFQRVGGPRCTSVSILI